MSGHGPEMNWRVETSDGSRRCCSSECAGKPIPAGARVHVRDGRSVSRIAYPSDPTDFCEACVTPKRPGVDTAPHPFFDEWRSYDRDVVPAEAADVQREECRRAFYAGAWAAFCAVLAATEPIDEDECERRLEALQNEIMTAPSDLSIERPQRTES